MLKIPPSAPLFLVAVLMPPASMAIEDCGTSVTECELRQEIKELKRQMKELQAAITVSSNGNVGIGTTNPVEKLHVNGTIHLGEGLKMWTISNDTLHLFAGHDDNGVQLQVNGNFLFSVNSDRDNKGGRRFDFGTGGSDGTAYGRWMVINDGKVGIATESPEYELDVKGEIRGKIVSPSDERHKQNIQILENALTKLQGLRGVSFKWKDKAQGSETQIGLIAQEVEKVLPELVSTDSEGYKSIAYGQLTAVLIEAIKELQQQNEKMAKKIEALSASQP